MPICSIADTPVPEFPAIMEIIELLSDSSEHNDAQNVAEEAQSPSRSPAYDDDLVSAEQSTLMENLRPGHSTSALVNTRSIKRPISKNKHFLEGESWNPSCGDFTEVVQIMPQSYPLRATARMARNLPDTEIPWSVARPRKDRMEEAMSSKSPQHQPILLPKASLHLVAVASKEMQ